MPTWSEHKDNLTNLVKDMVKDSEGRQSVNDIFDLPFNFVFGDLVEQTKSVKKSTSMLDAFGF